jgi:hypothetical protein
MSSYLLAETIAGGEGANRRIQNVTIVSYRSASADVRLLDMIRMTRNEMI